MTRRPGFPAALAFAAMMPLSGAASGGAPYDETVARFEAAGEAFVKGKRRVAVLPFAASGLMEEEAPLAEGFTEVLTNALTQFRTFIVYPRRDLHEDLGRFPGLDGGAPPEKAAEAGRFLGVETVLACRLERGAILSASCRLIASASGRAIGSEVSAKRDPFSLDEVLDVMEELAVGAVGALGHVPYPQEREALRIRARPVSTAEAFLRYAEGKRELLIGEPDKYKGAIGELKKAAKLDKASPFARAALAEAYCRASIARDERRGDSYHSKCEGEWEDAMKLQPAVWEVRKVAYLLAGRSVSPVLILDEHPNDAEAHYRDWNRREGFRDESIWKAVALHPHLRVYFYDKPRSDPFRSAFALQELAHPMAEPYGEPLDALRLYERLEGFADSGGKSKWLKGRASLIASLNQARQTPPEEKRLQDELLAKGLRLLAEACQLAWEDGCKFLVDSGCCLQGYLRLWSRDQDPYRLERAEGFILKTLGEACSEGVARVETCGAVAAVKGARLRRGATSRPAAELAAEAAELLESLDAGCDGAFEQACGSDILDSALGDVYETAKGKPELRLAYLRVGPYLMDRCKKRKKDEGTACFHARNMRREWFDADYDLEAGLHYEMTGELEKAKRSYARACGRGRQEACVALETLGGR